MEEKIWTVDELGGWDKAIHLCAPSGIGDISWVYSKIRHLPAMIGKQVLLSVSGRDKPNRGGDFIQLLPDVRWGGYLDDRESWQVISQCWPPDWMDHWGVGCFHHDFPQNISPNIFLEMGGKLKDWMPKLPTDYHYAINTDEYRAEADKLLDMQKAPFICVYVSNRSKETQKTGGWFLWDSTEWVDFLVCILNTEIAKNATLVMLGAEYDTDKTMEVAEGLFKRAAVVPVVVLGKPLGLALEVMRRCHYGFWYPSGLGILGNVLRVSGVMLLPWILKGLEEAYADPVDIGLQKYRAWADPSPADVLDWFLRRGQYHGFPAVV